MTTALSNMNREINLYLGTETQAKSPESSVFVYKKSWENGFVYD